MEGKVVMTNQNNQLALFGDSFGPELTGRLAVKSKTDDKTGKVRAESVRVLTRKEMAELMKLDYTKANHYTLDKAIIEDGMKLKGSIGAIVARLQQDGRVVGGKVSQSVNKSGDETFTITLKRVQNTSGIPVELIEKFAKAFGMTNEEVVAQVAKQAEAEKPLEVAATVSAE